MSASVVGVRYSNSNAPASPMAFNLASNATAGNALLCFVTTATGTLTTFTLSDSVNGAWTNNVVNANIQSVGTGEFYSAMGTALTTAATLTLTSARRPRNVVVIEVAGLSGSPPFDTSVTAGFSASPGSSQTANIQVGTTPTLAQASEIAFCWIATAFWGANSLAINHGTGWTNIIGEGTPATFGNATSGIGSSLDYIVVNATTALADPMTGGEAAGTAGFNGLIATFKGTAAATPTPSPDPNVTGQAVQQAASRMQAFRPYWRPRKSGLWVPSPGLVLPAGA